MEKSKKIGPQIYGYSVCLVCVITFLISITALVNAIISLTDPLHSGYTPPGSPSLASYENYKMDILKSAAKPDESSKTTYTPDEQTIRSMFESAKAEKIQTVRHEANGNLIVSSLVIFICIILFITHWRWMRKMALAEA